MSAQTDLNPTKLSKEDMEVIAFMVASKIEALLDKPMEAREAQKWMGIGKTKFYELVNAGVIPQCQGKLYLRSDIIKALKRA